MDVKKIKNREEKCTMDETMSVIGGKWSLPIIYTLFSGTMRFKELERSLPKISTRMLVKELKKLQEYKIVHRKAYATVPPTVEYSLTDRGKELEPIAAELYNWGQKYIS